MNRVWRQFRLEWKLFSRDRMAMFWTFLFPVFMLAGFASSSARARARR
jgi:hypothetical protein